LVRLKSRKKLCGGNSERSRKISLSCKLLHFSAELLPILGMTLALATWLEQSEHEELFFLALLVLSVGGLLGDRSLSCRMVAIERRCHMFLESLSQKYRLKK
jgi:hypothetical protein